MEQSKNIYRVLERRPEGKSLGRPRSRWKYNIKMDLRELGCDAGIWVGVGQDKDQWQIIYVGVVPSCINGFQ